MKKLLQIDSCLGILSTGKITESIATLARDNGWDTYIAHGARAVGQTKQRHYQITTKTEEYVHYAYSVLFDSHGLHCTSATKKLIRWIDEIKPDIIHLHCIHGYHLNYKVLFDYINQLDIPVVWTFHDCWAFTGHCAHFITVNCNKWKEEGCHDCQLLGDYPKALSDRSRENFQLKKTIFVANKNMHIIAVSEWLASFVKESFLGDKDIRVINNGIDIQKFKPCAKKGDSKYKILGVASAWNKDKGLFDFYKLRELLYDNDIEITLVGLTPEQIKQLPIGINGISRTNSVEELAHLYSEANIFVNPTYADSFPTVNMEALACGTPVVTYRTGGSPEIVDDQTGIVINPGDIETLANAIVRLRDCPLSSDICRNRAVRLYNKENRFMDYIKLYEELIK